MAAPKGAAANLGGPLAAAAARPSSAAPGCTAGAMRGPPACQQPPSGPTGLATLVKKWNRMRCGTLALATEGLKMYERPPSYVPTAADEDWPAAAAAARWKSLLSGSCWPIRAAMEAMSRLGILDPQGYRLFRLATPILARLAQADPSPRMVEQVLALWVREAEINLCLDDHTGAGLNPDTAGTSPAAAVGPDDASSAFREMPALQRTLFTADMRETARSAPLEARRVFHAAMVAALEQVRASPNGVDIRDALALYACQAGPARRWAIEAKAARYRATYCAHDRGERRATAKVAIKAMAKAEEAFRMAEYHAGAALAARGGWAAGEAPPEGPGSALRRGDGSGPVGLPDALSVEAQLAMMAAWEADAAGGNDEPVEASHMPGDASEESDETEAALNSIDGQLGADLTNGRNMCAPGNLYCPGLPAWSACQDCQLKKV